MSTKPSSSHASQRQEREIDEMVEETFPASDATQLPGRADGPPADAGRREPSAVLDDSPNRGTPRSIGNQGTVPSSLEHEETVRLSHSAAVTLRFEPGHRRLHVDLGDEMLLDAGALDRLIAALSQKRSQMDD